MFLIVLEDYFYVLGVRIVIEKWLKLKNWFIMKFNWFFILVLWNMII